ncbi:helix-turn-helix transcriptional regulator [Cytobacillus oceanisediminis]|uniref:helix-turn-helix transcriptional regulator n=1 Tax=Cytobacillus oceanisediminis TaxID=665099 RepID=UPI00203C42C5|nr:helix-turn-helix transcriptional regulator [Cytobacillus oceanisediminis]MCM3395973.1 helix-turn-helix transcriptional regulator [Cytobacillus oceanisediminis]
MKEVRIKNSVKFMRMEQGELTQGELAQKVGVTRQTMNLIEAQKYNPTIKVCLLIASSLNTTIDKLFWIEEDEV